MCNSVSARFLHIAVAKGRRALAYVLASKMAASGFLDLKEHNGQVRSTPVALGERVGKKKHKMTHKAFCHVTLCHADGSTDRRCHQPAPDRPGPADAQGTGQHAGPVGPLAAARLCRERTLPQSTGRSRCHDSLSLDAWSCS